MYNSQETLNSRANLIAFLSPRVPFSYTLEWKLFPVYTNLN